MAAAFPSAAMRRALTSWAVPADSNYTDWATLFNQKIDKFCNSEQWFHSGVNSHVYSSPKEYFDNLATSDTVKQWHDTLVNGNILKEMIKVGPIILIGLGIIFLVATCVFAFCFKPTFRAEGARYCCRGYFVDRTRLSLAHVGKPTRSCFFFLFGVLAICTLALSIVSYIYTANIIKGQKDVNCDAWLTFKGQYFGTSDMELTDMVRSDWKGTVAQNNELAPILAQTNPARPNILYDYIWDEYQIFKSALVTNTTHYCNDTLPVEIEHLNQVRGLFNEFFDERKKAGLDFEYSYSVQWVAPNQTGVYVRDLWDASALGITMIEKNIELLLGEKSPLLQRGYKLGMAAKATLEDVDFVFAGIIKNFEHASHLLNVGVYLFSSIVIVCCSVAIILLAVAIFILWKITKGVEEVEGNYEPKKWMKTQIYITYISFVLLFSVAFVTTGIAWLLGIDGSEICTWMREDLGRQGNWEALDPSMWNVTLHNTTDMELVLDTCVSDTGSGDIVSVLGLTAATEDLRTLVYETEDALRHEVKARLDLFVKGLEAGTIKTLFDDMNALIWQIPVSRESYWNETLHVAPFVNQFPVAILCLITGVGAPQAEAIIACRDDFSVFTTGLNKLNDKLNSVTSGLEATGDVHAAWCSRWLATQGPNGFTCPPNSIIIDQTWAMSRAEVVATVGAVANQIDEMESKRVETGIHQLIDFEKLFWTPLDLKTPNDLHTANYSLIVCDDKSKCCDNPSACTMNELLAKWRIRWVELGESLWMNYVYMNDATNVFLENVTIGTMENLLKEADKTLQNFDCQFAGTSLKEGLVRGLCDVALPSTGFMAIWLSLFSLTALGLSVLFFRFWHFLANQNVAPPPIERIVDLPRRSLTSNAESSVTSGKRSIYN